MNILSTQKKYVESSTDEEESCENSIYQTFRGVKEGKFPS